VEHRYWLSFLSMPEKEVITTEFEALQMQICKALEQEDGAAAFKIDHWKREGGGGGRSAVLENGALIEKGGVNFSAVWGASQAKDNDWQAQDSNRFYATGLSIVLHPQNPFAPIIHMNIRYFELDNGSWWFGGGIDLTPHYIDKEEAARFHKKLKDVCDRHDPTFYETYKPWADDYFYIGHRNETRGVGGIFFDRLTGEGEKQALFDFVMDVGRTFVPIYLEPAEKKRNQQFSEDQRAWQLMRRGRYVEFNLVLDRGTKFGRETNGRIESILMSLPPLASWKYDYQPAPGTLEWDTLQSLKKNINWINA
jgi:coproporphyrinogen III oxidase